jgi:hypothetical protein
LPRFSFLRILGCNPLFRQFIPRAATQGHALGQAEAKEGPMKTVLIYVNTSAGDVDHIVVFANEEAAEKWFAENDAEGVAFEYDVIGSE